MTTMTDHTHKAFDTDLQDLARMVAEMGGLAEKQIAESVDALAKRDTALAQRVTQADTNIDTLQREIEEKDFRRQAGIGHICKGSDGEGRRVRGVDCCHPTAACSV